ncbi:MAG: hypothetical protein MZU91_09745 [Desulfosudis oleivorans]|nr:hypothetical protein [Desulfosudis oleivorans]
MVLLALILASFPMIARAAEEAKPCAERKRLPHEPEEDKVTGEVAASILSAYIWRGQELTRHSVVIQPSVTASYKGFTANLWGNIDTKPYAAGNQSYSSNFTETDVTLSYSRKFGMVQAGAGYIYYGLSATTPGGTDLLDSQEIFVTLGLDTILAPTLTVYKEIDHYHQWYATLGVSHTFALHEKIGLKLAAQVSYLKSEDETTYPEFDSNSVATTDKFNNLHDGVVSISLPINVITNLTVTPTMTYVFPLSSDAKYEMRGRGLQGTTPSDRDSSYLYGGVVLSFAF